MEKMRDHVNIKLVTNEDSLRKLVRKPQFECVNIFSENLVAVRSKRTVVKMNKPIYLGVSILDISKTLMYNFHYNYIKKKYGDKASLLFTDTDSVCYETKTDDVYRDISPDVLIWFDTSEYDKDHPSGIPTGKNEKVVEMMKDECKGRQIKKFAGLRSKMLYSYVMEDGGEEKKCKGVKKNVVKNEIT